jgi:predicted DNA-binding protein YlxM (UPF0122 family)
MVSRKVVSDMNGKESGRLGLIADLNAMLDLAKEAFGRPDYTCNRGTFFGKAWLEIMDALESNGQATQELVRKLAKIHLPFESVMNLRGTEEYFDKGNPDAWYEKVRNLIHAADEETFDSNSYEFFIGSSLSAGKKIYFCNMDAKGGRGSQESLCEYFLEPRLFIECKNLFGVAKSAISNNIKKANSQLRSTMQKAALTDEAIGIAFIDLPERMNIENRDEISGKILEVLGRLRQSDCIHFLAVTFMNTVCDGGGISAIAEAKLIVNPVYNQFLQDRAVLNMLHPMFRSVAIPNEQQTFDIYDFIADQRFNGYSFDQFFGIKDE